MKKKKQMQLINEKWIKLQWKNSKQKLEKKNFINI